MCVLSSLYMYLLLEEVADPESYPQGRKGSKLVLVLLDAHVVIARRSAQ